jgi:hypothetical protein
VRECRDAGYLLEIAELDRVLNWHRLYSSNHVS